MRTGGHRSHWSSRWAFVLATAGSAIGLGNIWKFPYMAGQSGGGAFVLVYLLCIALVGLPIMMAEILIGRRAQRNPVTAMGTLAREAGASTAWKVVGGMGILAGVLILSFYSVVAGWMLDYLLRATGGAFTGLDAAAAQAAFDGLLASPYELALYHTLFMVMTMSVVAFGVTRGLERANKLMMPALFAIVLVLVGYGLARGDMTAAWNFLFRPDFAKLTPQVVLAAVGHAFFTLSLGMGAVMVYGSYLQRHVSIGRVSCYIAAADTAVALLAGLAVFSIVFANGLEPAAGPGLVMLTLPIAFGGMPGGTVIATVFYTLIVFAAWTSSISLAEPGIAWLSENRRMSRPRACLVMGSTVWALGMAVVFSFNIWSEVKLLGKGFFDLFDFVTSNVLLPLGGLAIIVFGGWVMHGRVVDDELDMHAVLLRLWRVAARYVAPIAILLVFFNLIGLLPGSG